MRRAALVACALVAGAVAAPAAGAAEWLSGDLHVHTTYSHDSYGGPADDNTGPEDFYTLGFSVVEEFALARSRGMDFLVITDHNDVRAQKDPGFGTMGVLGVPGYENSLKGHAQMIGATKLYNNGNESPATVRKLADALRRDGGAFQANHPADGERLGELNWEYAYQVLPDTVEGWNSERFYQPPAPASNDHDAAIRFWEGWLDRGFKVALTGGSDSHWRSTAAAQGAGQPTTWVYSSSRSVKGILAGLRAGRTAVSAEPPGLGGARIYLEADGNRDGKYEAMVGDTVPPGSPLRVRATGAPGSLLRVVTNKGRVAAELPVTGVGFAHRFSLPRSSTWARAEVIEPDLAEQRRAACEEQFGSDTTYCRNLLFVLAMTSSIYLRTEPDEPLRPGDRGSARMSSLRGCRKRRFRAVVTGSGIERVTFYLDGRRRKTVRKRDSKGRFTHRIVPRKLEPGRHRVTAKARFEPVTATKSRRLSRRFRVCASARRSARSGPRFTG